MPSPNVVTVAQLSRLIGLPTSPAIVDVRIDEDFDADPRMIPGSKRRDHRAVEDWAHELKGRRAVVLCHQGRKLSQGVAAWLRDAGIEAEVLDGGYEAWAGAPEALLVNSLPLPRDKAGGTLWVTRERPKIDRIACPWLIRRFVDADAIFLFVRAGDVLDVADKFNATPFDVEGVSWSHRGERCTFDTMLEKFGLTSAPLSRLADIVRGADTDQHDLAPQAAGLMAASLGFSRMYRNDLDQLDAAMVLYDAMYRWSRDAVEETHTWAGHARDAKS